MKTMIKSYASYFVSYLLNEIRDLSNIQKIVLFGSVAREEATRESDVDIFVEIKKKSKKIEKNITNILEKFYGSREAAIFKLKKIDNKINLIVGKLDEWPQLKDSIESTGILLYGPYISSKTGGKKYIIISWDKIGINRGAFLNKIYGYKIKEKRYKGLIEQFNGIKIGKSSIMVPVEHRGDIFILIKKYNISAKVFEVYM